MPSISELVHEVEIAEARLRCAHDELHRVVVSINEVSVARHVSTAPLDQEPILIYANGYGWVQAWFFKGEGQGEDREGPSWVCCDAEFELEVEEFRNEAGDLEYSHGKVTAWLPLPATPTFREDHWEQVEIARERNIKLSPDQWKEFNRILDQPPAANNRLKKLLLGGTT